MAMLMLKNATYSSAFKEQALSKVKRNAADRSDTPNDPKDRKKGPDCTDQPTFHACMSCCSTTAGQLSTTGAAGSFCAEACYRKEGFTKNEPNQCLASGS